MASEQVLAGLRLREGLREAQRLTNKNRLSSDQSGNRRFKNSSGTLAIRSTCAILGAVDKKKLTAFIFPRGPEKFNMPCEH